MSVNVTIVWTILDSSENVYLNITTTSLELTVDFLSIGRYRVECIVSNLLGSEKATSHIIVREPVGKVNLSCIQGPYIEVEQEVICSAETESGSGLKFEWDFQENAKFTDISFGNDSSTAKHTFMYPGIYNISVAVHNELSTMFEQLPYSIYVEIPLECLNVNIKPSPVLHGNPVTIVATATRGTSLKFDLDLGFGKVDVLQEVEVNGDTTIFSAKWVFQNLGLHHITVIAHNHISSVARSVDVHVQLSPPEFQIQLLPTPLPSFSTVTVKTTEGAFLYREDLLFYFHFSDGVRRITQVPVVIWEVGRGTIKAVRGAASADDLHFSDKSKDDDDGQAVQNNVKITVSNKVGQKSKALVLADNESRAEKSDGKRRNKKRRRRRKRPSLWHPTFVKAEESTSFLLENKSRGINALHIDYGDGLKENVSCLSDSCSWGRKFRVPGVFALDVSLYGRRRNRKDQALRSVLVVEEPIKGLRLLGPTDVGIECDQDWKVEVNSGSHLVYVWSLDGIVEEPTTIGKYVVGFSETGTHTLHVNVSNDISWKQTSLSFSVKHPVIDVSLSIPPNIPGIPSNITVLIEGGREFIIRCNFGDGQHNTFSSEGLALVEIGSGHVVPSGYPQNPYPVYEVLLNHTYKDPGEYNVSVTVANGISVIHRSSRAVVEEAIGEVTLLTDTPQLMSVHDELVVTAVVSSGRNLKFDWDFSDIPPSVESDGNSSTASHVFSIPDEYEISVTVSNHLQKEGVRVTLPHPVVVVDPVFGATIAHVVKSGHGHPQNAAALLIQSDGRMSTQEVQFEAKSDGSSVEFTFDFGDGHTATVEGTENMFFRMMLASAKHVYTEEGIYTVQLTASNALGNLTVHLQEPFYVQIPPSGLSVEASDTCIQFGEIARFSASVQAGTNVSYSWKLNDQTELINTGSYVEHQYRSSGVQDIQVTAHNMVDSISAYLSVEVVEKVLGVNLSVSDTIVVAGEPKTYVAMMHPPSAAKGSWYEWEFSPLPPFQRGYEGKYKHTYTVSGRHFVQVKAINCLGSATSPAVPLHVVAKLLGLTITILGDAVVASPVTLRADYWQGDSLTFTWDFGDGSDPVVINSSQTATHMVDRKVRHNYTQIGEYIVHLKAENPVSMEEVSRRIFILNQPCDPPDIMILGALGQTNNHELTFLHSEPIRMESEVRVNCTVSSHVKFKWEVVDAANNRAVNLMVPWARDQKVNKHLRCPALLLPPWTLAQGKYRVKLQVEMNGTQVPVYSEAEVQISVLSTPLVSTIHGGIYRHAGQDNLVQLDGRGSGYPDNSSANLGYLWSCSPLGSKGKDCFESPDQMPVMNTSHLSFPADWLTSNFSVFAFNFTVFKLSRHTEANDTAFIPGEEAVSSQVISLQPERATIDLLIECPQCWRNMVNSDKKVSLRTHCPNCPKGPLTYNWEVFLLAGEDVQFSSIDKVHSVCVNADGSSYQQLSLGSSPNSTAGMTKGTSTAEKVVGDGVRVPKSQSPPVLITERPEDAELRGRSEPRRGERRGGRMPTDGFPPDPAEDETQGSRRLDFSSMHFREGMGGSSGSFSGRNIGGGFEDPQEVPGGGRDITSGGDDLMPGGERVGGRGCPPHKPDCLRRDPSPSPEPPHLVSRHREPILLTKEQTFTGLDQPSLVIKPGVLGQGRTYFVQVTATAKDGSSGLAMAYFQVNQSPSKGKCTVRPLHGKSMEDIFIVFCNAWQDGDEHLPLRYEVSYSLNGSENEEDLRIVYHGLRHEISFQLPAGLAAHDYKVLLHIAVLDRLGAKTLICRIPIEVRPAHSHAENGAAAATDILLRNEARSLLQLASRSIYDGVSHDLFGPLTQVATHLNARRASGRSGDSRTNNSVLTRHIILETLIYIPLRDEVELIQALICLVETTNQPRELDHAALLKTRALLKDISEEAKSLFAAGVSSGRSRGLSSQVLHLAVRAVSNLFTALVTNHAVINGTSQQQQHFKSITKSIINDGLMVVNNLMQLELQYHSLGEQPVSLKDRFISLNASHFSLRQLSPVVMNGVLFQLPTSLQTLLSKHLVEGSDSGLMNVEHNPAVYGYKHNMQCFQARALSFLTNPFAFITRKTDMVQSELASLDIYNCFGDDQIDVQGLPNDNMVQIVIPRKANQVTNATSGKHYLHKSSMNIHQLNASLPPYNYDSSEDHVEISDRYLHVHIQLEPVLHGRTFPIMVIISSHDAPYNLRHHVYKQQYDRGTEDIKIFLSPGSVEGGQHYYIGLVEASFNSGRRRSDEIEGRYYTLNTWWGTCVYWNHTEDRWRSNGCTVMPTSSVEALHCRCSHLTTFGGYFQLVPNELSFADVDEFFSLHENPVVVILVAVIALLYLILVTMLRQADAHDARKGNCVYLQDNTMSHPQKYEVVMETGFNRAAGTTSKISIILHGEEGMSETRELISDDNRPMFERNSRDRFIVTLPDSLGKIFKIQLWHNNSGSSPGWFLRQVVVRDLNTGQAFYFLCQKWLAVDRDDGKVEREFTAVDVRNINFSMIFWCKGSQYLSDFHTWMSVWTCPPHSRFTRVQRLTVCFTLLMVYMCLSAMWFKQSPSGIRGEFGLLDLSWHSIIVGCICCAIVVPLNLILSFLFRRSRVHYPGYEQDKVLVRGKSGCELNSEGEEEPPQPAVTYSILDQSILNWQNIQDWAQKQWLKRQQSVRSSANSVKTTQTSPQLSAPSTTPLVQQTLLAEDDTDQASSGFEDATSQATAERHRIKATSDISSDGKKSRNVEHSDMLNASRRIFLPFWCRHLAWVLCFLISCTCGTITILYGFRFGHTKSTMWIQSVYFSFMVCLFIAQPLLILMYVVYTAACHRNNPAIFDHYDDGFYGERVTSGGLHKQHSHYNEEEEELQRGVAERSRSRYLRFAGPPQEKHLKSARKKLIKQRRAMLLLSDTVWFIFMAVLLCIIAFGKDAWSPFQLNSSLRQAFAEKKSNGTSFLRITSAADWYTWAHSVLLDTLYSHTSLGEGHVQMGEQLGYLIGQVQVRQLKAKFEPCHNIRRLDLDHSCMYDYSLKKEGNLASEKLWSDRQAGNRNINPGIWGQVTWYDTSGSILQLNRSREVAVAQLRSLEAEKWIDLQTRAIFVELTLYNTATNLFSSVTLLAEVSPTRQILTSAYIMSTYVFRYNTRWDNCVLGCELLFIILALWMCFGQLKHMVRMGKSYFYHFWNYIELLMSVVSLLYVGFYIYRFFLVSEVVEFMRSTFYEEFINLAFLTLWDEFLRELSGVILFFVILKLLLVLRYHQLFWRLQRVYRKCKTEILVAAILYAGLIMAFSSLSSGLFGTLVYNVRSLWSSMLTMSALSVRVVQWPDERNTLSDQSHWLDIVLLFSYTFCHGFILTYIFIVLACCLKKTKNYRVLAMPGHQLLAFYWDRVLKWTGSRPEACYERQTDNTLPPEFTMAEILYLVEEMLFRMNSLLGTSGLPDKRHSFTDSDATPNEGDDGISSGGSEDKAIPMTTTTIAVEGARLEQRVQKIEDKLCSNEPYLAQLLKLDSIGTDILSEEKEKELRSHLEFEIFRQLQMQRQDSSACDGQNQQYLTCPMLEPMLNLNLTANGISGPNSPGLAQLSDEAAAAQAGGIAKSLLLPPPQKSKEDNFPSSKTSPESTSSDQEFPHDPRSAQEMQGAQPRPILLLPPKRSQSMKVPGKQAGRHHIAETVKGQKQWLDLSTSNEMAREAKLRAKFLKAGTAVQKHPKLNAQDSLSGPATNEKKARGELSVKKDVPTLKKPALSKDLTTEAQSKSKDQKGRRQEQSLGFNLAAATQNASSGNVSPQSSESERGHKRTDSSSGQSGHERNDTPRGPSKKPELPPKPTFAHSILPPIETGKALTGRNPKPRQFTFMPELMNPVGAESSSGSEQEATLSSKRANQGRRNLRKTKSRGKGKGNEGGIASPMVLAADFGSSGQSGGSDFDIIIHPVPSGIDPDDMTMPEEYLN